VRGKPPEAIHAELRLRVGSVPGDDNLTFQIVGAGSDAGWYLIVANGREHRLIRETAVKPLSTGCEVVTCTADEQNTFSEAADWRDGQRVWSVSYDGEEGPADVVVSGEPPFEFSLIRDRYTAEAQAPDAGDALIDPMFEIPVELVHGVIGYKPRASSPAFHGRFVLLEGMDTPWYKRWTVGG
jgi:hypothetical protein